MSDPVRYQTCAELLELEARFDAKVATMMGESDRVVLDEERDRIEKRLDGLAVRADRLLEALNVLTGLEGD